MTVRVIFADSLYWVALTNPRDQWRSRALAASRRTRGVRLFTTEEVLTEVLNGLTEIGSHVRSRACELILRIRTDPDVEVLPQSHDTFEAGFDLYQARPDKGYSLTDCVSMQVMRERELTEVMTHDHHFAQEGFTILL